MIPRTIRHYVIPAILIWLVAAVLAVGLWSVLAVGSESDPTNYAYARSYLRGEVRIGHLPKDVADRRLADLRWQLFNWIVEAVRLPVLISALSIPLMAWLMARAGSNRWVLAWLAVLFAILIPFGTFVPRAVNTLQSESHSGLLVSPGGTPVATPAGANETP